MGFGMFVVKVGDLFHGPFLRDSADHFAESAGVEAEVHALRVPIGLASESERPTVRLVEDEEYRVAHDAVTAESLRIVAGVTQSVFFAFRAGRVLTRDELDIASRGLGVAYCAIESLMHYAQLAADSPTPEHLAALRKAFWRNRGCEDVDPHYADRSW